MKLNRGGDSLELFGAQALQVEGQGIAHHLRGIERFLRKILHVPSDECDRLTGPIVE